MKALGEARARFEAEDDGKTLIAAQATVKRKADAAAAIEAAKQQAAKDALAAQTSKV